MATRGWALRGYRPEASAIVAVLRSGAAGRCITTAHNLQALNCSTEVE